MKLFCLLAAVTFLTGCGGSPAGGADSGIRGRALLAPACPVEPCSVSEQPYTGSFVVRKDGAVVAKVKTDGEGRFDVRLEPGQYVLESESAGLLQPTGGGWSDVAGRGFVPAVHPSHA
jgi:hypothetical protein